VETLESKAVSGWHPVTFYDSDAELAWMVGRFLLDAVRGGGVAIAVGTRDHCRAFRAELERAGIDVEQALVDRSVIFRDAAESLATFMLDGSVDEQAFLGSVGSLVGAATAKGGPVHIYGEMVSLLWEAGDVEAAMELEGVWDTLGRQLRFSLLCGYRSSSVSDAGAAERLCGIHSSVEALRRFPARADGPREARHFVRAVLKRCGSSAAHMADAQLVVSELATNAVVHARSTFSVHTRIEDGELLLWVRDESAEPPRLLCGSDDQHGRGLRVVDAVASEWGFDLVTGRDGKVVWAWLGSRSG
jgi:anti-sigma regulatory factor (Ser/Thr protein kinase)